MMFLVGTINLMHDNHFADGGEHVDDQFEDDDVVGSDQDDDLGEHHDKR